MSRYKGTTYSKLTAINAELDVVSASISATIPTATATAIADASSAINTANKAAGSVVFDTDNNRLKVATGATPTSTWVNTDGQVVVTPS